MEDHYVTLSYSFRLKLGIYRLLFGNARWSMLGSSQNGLAGARFDPVGYTKIKEGRCPDLFCHPPHLTGLSSPNKPHVAYLARLKGTRILGLGQMTENPPLGNALMSLHLPRVRGLELALHRRGDEWFVVSARGYGMAGGTRHWGQISSPEEHSSLTGKKNATHDQPSSKTSSWRL